MRGRWRFALGTMVVALATAAAPCVRPLGASHAQPERVNALVNVVVVVNASNPTAALSREQVARIFLKKLTRWPSGALTLPADLPEKSPVRAAFTDAVLGKTMPTIRAYWHARIFTGRDLPPPEKDSESDAIAYVGENAGAIAYVSAHTTLPNGVRVLVVTD